MVAESPKQSSRREPIQNPIARAQSREDYEVAHDRPEMWMTRGDLWIIFIAINLQKQDRGERSGVFPWGCLYWGCL
jgi:hypothetical protein